MRCKAVDRHNMMGERWFRVEELKIRTFIFRFLGLIYTVQVSVPSSDLGVPRPPRLHAGGQQAGGGGGGEEHLRGV